MTRQARIDAPGALHHLICRGIERGRIFLDDTDRDHFVERLAALFPETSTSCFAWVLIANHFHLLVRTGCVPVSTVMRRLLTSYALRFNRRHRRSGHVFQNRYKSIFGQRARAGESQECCGLLGSPRTGTGRNGSRQGAQLDSVRRQQIREKGRGDCERARPLHG